MNFNQQLQEAYNAGYYRALNEQGQTLQSAYGNPSRPWQTVDPNSTQVTGHVSSEVDENGEVWHIYGSGHRIRTGKDTSGNPVQYPKSDVDLTGIVNRELYGNRLKDWQPW